MHTRTTLDHDGTALHYKGTRVTARHFISLLHCQIAAAHQSPDEVAIAALFQTLVKNAPCILFVRESDKSLFTSNDRYEAITSVWSSSLFPPAMAGVRQLRAYECTVG